MESLQPTLLRFYIKQVFWSCGSSLLATFLFTLLFIKSEHLDPDFMIIYFSLVIAGLFAAFSLTLFLNVFDSIRSKIIFSGIAWFALPGFLLGYIMYMIPEPIGLVCVIPYAIGLIITFWRFRKRLHKPKRASLEIITKENRKTDEGSSVENSIWG